jgi:hypothetical protein
MKNICLVDAGIGFSESLSLDQKVVCVCHWDLHGGHRAGDDQQGEFILECLEKWHVSVVC